jgi:hypothetical protein
VCIAAKNKLGANGKYTNSFYIMHLLRTKSPLKSSGCHRPEAQTHATHGPPPLARHENSFASQWNSAVELRSGDVANSGKLPVAAPALSL